MKGLNEIKSRIGGVRDTLKITKAMYVISAAKMSKCLSDMANAVAYLTEIDRAVSRLMCPRYAATPYLMGNADGKETGFVVITGNKGLCGDYNDKVLSFAWDAIAPYAERKIFTVGNVAEYYFKGKNVKVSTAFSHMMANPLPEDAAKVADRMMDDLVESKLREVYLVYTRANHLFDQEVVMERLLPIPYEMQTEDVALSIEDGTVSELLNEALRARVYSALMNAYCALNYKHMTSMREAANNGESMLEELTQTYNHARQAAITAELNDVNVARMATEDNL